MSNLKNIQNVEQAKQANLTHPEAIELITDFHMFNPNHILPADKAKKYLDENWEGRSLDLKHFGLQKIQPVFSRPVVKNEPTKEASPPTQIPSV